MAFASGPSDADRRQLVVLAIQHELQLFPKQRRVEQVADAQTNSA